MYTSFTINPIPYGLHSVCTRRVSTYVCISLYGLRMCLFNVNLFSLHKCSVDPVYVIASYTFSTVYHTKVQYLNPICGCVVVRMYWFVLMNCFLCVMCVLCVFLGTHERIVYMSSHSTHLYTSEYYVLYLQQSAI